MTLKAIQCMVSPALNTLRNKARLIVKVGISTLFAYYVCTNLGYPVTHKTLAVFSFLFSLFPFPFSLFFVPLSQFKFSLNSPELYPHIPRLKRLQASRPSTPPSPFLSMIISCACGGKQPLFFLLPIQL